MNRVVGLAVCAVFLLFSFARATEEFERKEIDAENDSLMKTCMEDQIKSQDRFSKGYSHHNSGTNGWVGMFFQQLSDRVLHQVPSQVKMTMCMLESAFGWDGEEVPYSATRTMEMRGAQGGSHESEGGRGALYYGATSSFTIYSKMTVAEATVEEKGSLFDSGDRVRVVQAWFGSSPTAVTSDTPKVRIIYAGRGYASRGVGVFNDDGTVNGQGENKYLRAQTIRWDRNSEDSVQSVAVQEVMQSTPGEAFGSVEGNQFAPTGGDRNFHALANYYPQDYTDSKGTVHSAGELEISVNERSAFGTQFKTIAATAILNRSSGEGSVCISGQEGASGTSYSRPSHCFRVAVDTSTGDISSVERELSTALATSQFDNRKVFGSEYNPSPNSMGDMHEGGQYSHGGAADTERFKPSQAGGAFAQKKFHD